VDGADITVPLENRVAFVGTRFDILRRNQIRFPEIHSKYPQEN
jgi:hypothetical protein